MKKSKEKKENNAWRALLVLLVLLFLLGKDKIKDYFCPCEKEDQDFDNEITLPEPKVSGNCSKDFDVELEERKTDLNIVSEFDQSRLQKIYYPSKDILRIKKSF